MAEDSKSPLGRILLRQRAVTEQALEEALGRGATDGQPLATRMIEAGTLTELAALKALSEQQGVPGIDLDRINIRLKDLDIVPREVALRHKLLPVLVRDDRVFVAMASPTEKRVIDEIEFVSGKHVFPYVALAGALLRVITAAYEMRDRGEERYLGPHATHADASSSLTSAVVDSSSARSVDTLSAPPGSPSSAPWGSSSSPGRPSVPSSGSTSSASGASGASGVRSVPAPPSSRVEAEAKFRPAATSAVVLDDTMRRAAAAPVEANDADFGDVARELSVVAELPKDPTSKSNMPDGRRTILVVDDEADIRKMVRRVLEERGYRVTEAARGHEALARLKERPPDLVVLDAMLPEVHGFDIAKRMKDSERYGHIPIVMISAIYRGWRFAEDVKQSYGVDAYLEKPFKMADLVAAVESAINQRPNGADVETISAEAERRLASGIAAYQRGDLDGAVAELREGTRIDPLAYRLHFHLGLLYGKQGQIFDAIQELQTALDINKTQFPALKNLAVLYQKAGFRNKAIETWERALRAAPDEATRQTIKDHLVGLL